MEKYVEYEIQMLHDDGNIWAAQENDETYYGRYAPDVFDEMKKDFEYLKSTYPETKFRIAKVEYTPLSEWGEYFDENKA